MTKRQAAKLALFEEIDMLYRDAMIPIVMGMAFGQLDVRDEAKAVHFIADTFFALMEAYDEAVK